MKFIMAFRPCLISPALAARTASTFDRLSNGRLSVNIFTGGSSANTAVDGLWLAHDERYEVAEFFSFGTNDLMQMSYGISRDDAERKFLLAYVTKGILPENPFQLLDRSSVGQLMQMAT